MNFNILGEIHSIEIIAKDNAIRERSRLQKIYGQGRWRKVKGIARIKLPDDFITNAEIHWYEAHGIGKKELKIKQYLD